jgi:hypothetical protein
MHAKLVFTGADVQLVDERGRHYRLTRSQVLRSKLIRDILDAAGGNGCAVLPVTGEIMKVWMSHVDAADKRCPASCDRLAKLLQVRKTTWIDA